MTQVSISDPQGNPFLAKAYSNARKLFQIGDLPVAAMTWGLGNIGPRTVENLILEFGASSGNRDVKDIAGALLSFLQPLYGQSFTGVSADKQPLMGFLVGGYSPPETLPEEWEFVLPWDNAVREVRPKEEFGASWRGIERPFSRLCNGFDPEMVNWLKSKGIPEPLLNTIFERSRWAMRIMFDGMPTQDAINFAEFVLRTTIGVAEFETGSPVCGGPLQVVLIGADKRMQWISQPKLGLRGVSI